MSDDRRSGHGRLWSLLLLAVVAVAAAGVTIAAGGTGTPARTVVATTPGMSVSLPATTTPPPATTSGPQPTIATGTLPTAPGAPSTAATTTAPPPVTTSAPPPRKPAIRSWPAGRSGYTTVLLSLPESAGRAAAVARAHGARAAGLPQVGVLDSSAYASLRHGYWVVFSGVYSSSGRAQSAAAAAHVHGFPGAYPARVAP